MYFSFTCIFISSLFHAYLTAHHYLTDIYPGECKHVMTRYLSCIKKVKGVNDDECRNLAKSYLACRMDRYEISLCSLLKSIRLLTNNRNLMAKDDFKNLGFHEESKPETPISSSDSGKPSS